MHSVLRPIILYKIASKEENQGDATTSVVTILSDYELTFCISETNDIQICSTCYAKANSKEFLVNRPTRPIT